MDKRVSLYSVEEVERLMGWDCKVSLVDLQGEIFLKIDTLKS